MKPVQFGLETPGTIEEAVALLAGADVAAKVLAGGQSLIPLMNFRLAVPDLLVDLNRVSELSYIRAAGQDLAIGAMTRQCDVERSTEVARFAPLLAGAVPFVAHPPIRNRGTVGGSLAHADPASEICTVMLALDATVTALSEGGERKIGIRDFFVGPLMTALSPHEILTEVSIPPAPNGGWAFDEVARRRGDLAIVGVAALLSLDGDGRIKQARLAYASMGGTPLRAYATEAALVGQQPRPEVFAEAAKAAVVELASTEDVDVARQYRDHVAEVLTRRVLAKSLARALGTEPLGGSANDGR
jgi:carbon-monoxide dehydrogenase medium subunit